MNAAELLARYCAVAGRESPRIESPHPFAGTTQGRAILRWLEFLSCDHDEVTRHAATDIVATLTRGVLLTDSALEWLREGTTRRGWLWTVVHREWCLALCRELARPEQENRR